MSGDKFAIIWISGTLIFTAAFALALEHWKPTPTVQSIGAVSTGPSMGINPYTGGPSFGGIDITTGHLATQPRP